MVLKEEDDNLIRRYLLGELAGAPELYQQVEERLLSDDDFITQLQLAETELIEDYADGRLNARDRAAFEQHFLLTPQRRQQLALVTVLRKYATQNSVKAVMEPQPARSNWAAVFTSKWQVAVYAVLAVTVGLGIWRAFFYESAVDKGLVLLTRAFPEERPLEARLTGFAYAPYVVKRGASEEKANYQLEEAEVLLRRAAREESNVAGLRGLGLLYLAKKDFAKAVAQFEQALKLEPRNARLHSELGAALLEKSRLSKQADEQQNAALEISRALEELSQALLLDASLPEALFNRALCRQILGLDDQAAAGWQEYLQKDPSSPWAEEARRNLRLLEEKRKKVAQLKQSLFDQFVAAYAARDEESAWQFFQHGRSRHGNSITEKLLDQHLTGQTNTTEQTESLPMLAFAGEVERRKTGDRFTRDLAGYYRNLSQPQTVTVRQAHELMKAGAADYNGQPPKLESAMARFLKAHDFFSRAGNLGEAGLAESRANYCRNRLSAASESVRSFQELVQFYRAKNYLSLLAYAWLGLADAYTGSDDFSNSVHAAQQARQTANQCADSLCTLISEGTLASLYSALGRFDESLTSGLQGISLSSQLPVEVREIWGFYSLTPTNLLALGLELSALEIQQAALQQADQSGWPLYQSLAYARFGVINARLGRYEEAVRIGDLSVAKAQQIADQTSREMAIADAHLYQGDSLRQADQFKQANNAYKLALEVYDRSPFRLFAYKAAQGSFLANLARQDQTSAKADLEKANLLLENFRGRIIEESSRNAFFSNGQEFYDAAIQFELEQQNDVGKAFYFAESARARSLLEARQSGARVIKAASAVELQLTSSINPFSLNEIQRRLAANTQIVQYSVLKDKVVAWVVTSQDCALAKKSISAGLLQEKIERFVRLLSVPHAITQEVTRQANELYELLIKPVAPWLKRGYLLCIVPDKSLHYLPFAALHAADTGRFFIEDHSFIIAPGATTFILSAESDRRKQANQLEQLLCIGNPRLTKSTAISLPELPAARIEAESIAAMYPAHVLLVEEQARESSFRKQASAATVIHIASHALIDERAPLLSKLMFAAETLETGTDEEMDGALHAYELYQMRFPRARLVVLSACQTGRGRNYSGEGVINLARPFLSAGVPVVVASLWNVESDETAELMKVFYRARKEQAMRAPDALRTAQKKMLEPGKGTERASFTWAAFTAIGGVN